jgi:hypothetical protein
MWCCVFGIFGSDLGADFSLLRQISEAEVCVLFLPFADDSARFPLVWQYANSYPVGAYLY